MIGASTPPELDTGLAIAAGAPLRAAGEVPPSLIDGVAARLALWPDGELWTCDDAGRPRGATYAELWRRSLAVAAALQARGIGAGDVVALVCRDARDFTAGLWACLRTGCVILPMTRRTGRRQAEDLAEVLGGLERLTIVADQDAGELAQDAARRLGLGVAPLAELEREGSPQNPSRVAPSPGTAICLIPTSGSTGRVKLAALPEAVLIQRRFLRQGASDDGITPVMVFDLDTITGLNAAFLHMRRYVQISPAVAAGRPLAVVDAIERSRASRMTLTCSLAGLLADSLQRQSAVRELGSLKVVSLGGERVDPFVAGRLADALARHGAKDLELVCGYGASETGNLAVGAKIPKVGSAEEAAGPLSLGGPPMGVTLRIVDEVGQPVRSGVVGAIEAKAPGFMFAGYWGDDAATRDAFTADGWWRSGDLGALRDGELWLHGRVKEVIIARGKKQALHDIDTRLQAMLADFPLAAVGGRVLSWALQRPGQATEQLGLAVFANEPPPPGERELLTRALRRTAAMEFGLNPAAIAFAGTEELPLGPGGKLVRSALAELVGTSAPPPLAGGAAPSGGRLADLWRQVLGGAEALNPDSDFFELGGDSLASEQLFAGVEAWFGRRISPEAFFADPTLGNMQDLLDRSASPRSGGPPEDEPWPLPPQLRDNLLTRLETWPGDWPTSDRLMASLNPKGARPPLFWIFQGGEEFAALGEALGPDQPLYGFRSGHQVFRYTEDSIQQVALRYLQDVLEACPEGPLFLGGNCQGGVIALAMAQHLARRRRTPPLLALMEWGFELQPYPGRVLFLHGAGSLQGDPYLRHQDPELAWRRLLGPSEAAEIPGAHGGFFWPGNVETLARLLSRRLEAAMADRAPALTPADVLLELTDPPGRARPGQRLRLAVGVRNIGRSPWAGADALGLAVGDYWLAAGGEVERWVDARTPLPPLAPGESASLELAVAAPRSPGRYTLVVDVVEEGVGWLDRPRTRAPSAEIEVAAE